MPHSDYGTTNSPTTHNCTQSLIRRHQPDWRHSPHAPVQSPDGISETTFSTRPRQDIVTGTRQQIVKPNQSKRVTICGVAVSFGSTLRILGVTLDSEPTFDEHITLIVRACNFHLCALRHIRHLIDREAANTIALSIVYCRLGIRNSIPYGVTENNIGRLQRVQNELARVVYAPYHSSATVLRRSLHWLPIKQRIAYKVAMMTFKVRLHQQPQYLSELFADYRPSRTVRSSGNDLLAETRTKTIIASRAFSSTAPHVWNSLPPFALTATSIEIFISKSYEEIPVRHRLQ